MMTLFERQSERARAFAKRLAKDEGGATIMEFGLVSVVFITMMMGMFDIGQMTYTCLLYTSPSPRDLSTSRMPSSA